MRPTEGAGNDVGGGDVESSAMPGTDDGGAGGGAEASSRTGVKVFSPSPRLPNGTEPDGRAPCCGSGRSATKIAPTLSRPSAPPATAAM
ncbi:MAG: hypothetical protein M0D55_10310 [Elusimicrobiota bacterium]|nr:MAG: hypothetical protein M0D55_10310 [Elusimicrobiota bacterium]